MTEKGTAQFTLRKTPERQALMNELRKELEDLRPGEGERIHGRLTDAQIFDWALEMLAGYVLPVNTSNIKSVR